MPDKFDAKTRSKIMSRIRSKDTAIEIVFRRLLWNAGMRGYRLHYNAPGKPDIAFVSKRIAVFIDGDFWHGYNWQKLGKVPPRKYWQKKISKNIARDKKNTALLRKKGWKVIRLWEHELKKSPAKSINKVKLSYFSNKLYK
jgi:DNA mismatch endonuclease (patch repair protein)